MLIFLSLALLARGAFGASGDPGPAPPAPSRQEIVLELFTSQGCSSCPPADELLWRLSNDTSVAPYIIPLAYHIDYWDGPAWKDPFSQHAFSERQEAYEKALHVANMYSPQLVVDGKAECVGSNEQRVRTEIADARNAAPATDVSLQIQPDTGKNRAARLSYTVRITDDLHSDSADIMAAIFEGNRITSVTGGENAGRMLNNDFIARSLQKIGSISGRRGASVTNQAVLPLSPEWDEGNLGVVIFIQDPASLAIHGAASQMLHR